MTLITALPYTAKMNKLERAWADQLDLEVAAGEVVAWRFEAVKLRLADATFYTPDFLVIHDDGHCSLDEVKGFWREDARVKIKVAAEMFPWFAFRAVHRLPRKQGGGWEMEQFGPQRP